MPCAYERSAKLARGSLLANRYLLAFEARDISHAHIEFACNKLNMPAAVVASIQKRCTRASKFMIGFEDAGDGVVFKVYLELLRRRADVPCCHIGWKQSIPQPGSTRKESHRTAFYKPLRPAELNALVACVSEARAIASDAAWPVLREAGSAENSALRSLSSEMREIEMREIEMREIEMREIEMRAIELQATVMRAALLREVLGAARARNAELICLLVSEAAGRRSHDWNVYSANLRLDDFARSIHELAELDGIDRSQINRWLQLSGHTTLGHIASGTDAHGDEFLTLYYSAD